MQFTPYRLWLGGIRTGSIDYAPLAREVEAPGRVVAETTGRTTIEADFYINELSWIRVGYAAKVRLLSRISSGPLDAQVKGVPTHPPGAGETGRVVVEVVSMPTGIRVDDLVSVTVRCPVEDIQPFRSRSTVAPLLYSGEPRRLYSCMEHTEVHRIEKGRCPLDQSELMSRDLRPNERVRWWCPMHPEVTAERSGSTCESCNGMALVPRLISYRPPGKVLAVPSSAVIEDGVRTLVFVETGMGMFDAKAVTLGPRCGDQYPVIDGLTPYDRVAIQGAFLIDAETRLNPSLAAGYFGAGAGSTGREKTASLLKPGAEEKWPEGLAAIDRPRAVLQKICPVTGKPLGSMGVPPKIAIEGRSVFVCCGGCTAALEANPAKYLAKLPPDRAEARP